MGIQIITGGPAAQFAAGASQGYDEGMARRREEEIANQLAADMVQATNMAVLPKIESLDAQIPQEERPQGPLEVGATPDYMRPQASPEREQLNMLAETYAQGIQGMRDPRAIAAYGQAASEQLDQVSRQLMVSSVNNTLKAASASGALDPDVVQHFTERLGAGDDVASVYEDLAEAKQAKLREVRRATALNTYLEDASSTVESYMQRAAVSQDPEESAWLTQQAGRLRNELAAAQAAAGMGLDDFDFDAVRENIEGVRNALNPAQKRAYEQFQNEQRMELDAREAQRRVILDDDDLEADEKINRLRQIDRGATGGYPAQRMMELPGGQGGEEGSQVLDLGDGGGESASKRSKVDLTPEEIQRNEVKREAVTMIDTVSFGGLETPEEIDARAAEVIQSVVGTLFPDGTVNLSGEGSDLELWTEAVTARIEALREEDPTFAQLLAGRVLRVLEMAEEAKSEPPKRAERDAKRKRANDAVNDGIGGAAWGGA